MGIKERACRILAERRGNIGIYTAVTVIICAAILAVGTALARASQCSALRGVSTSNSGFGHYVSETAGHPVGDQ